MSKIWREKYQLIETLANTKFSKVYLVQHRKLLEYRIIKCILKSHQYYDILMKEADILKEIKHSCIPLIYDIEEDEECSYIIEQYMEGETLRHYMNSHRNLSEQNIINISIQICNLILYLHSLEHPILYLDLHPDNVIIRNHTVYLVDFGASIFYDRQGQHKVSFGTRRYAAPEQYTNGILGPATDVYGIGMLLYYLVTGGEYQGNNKIKNVDNYSFGSKQLKSIINRCLKHNPSQRFFNLSTLQLRLKALQDDHVKYKEKQQIVIGIMGSQSRIGTTHLSMLIHSYLYYKTKSSIYVEANDHNTLFSIAKRLKGTKLLEDKILLYHRPYIPKVYSETVDLTEYEYVIKDYGVYEEASEFDIKDCHVKILVLGGRDWELEYSEKAIYKLKQIEDIKLAFNFLDGEQFKRAVKELPYHCSYRIPYAPNLFLQENTAMETFILDMIQQPHKRIK